MKNRFLNSLAFFYCLYCNVVLSAETSHAPLPGRLGSDEVKWAQFGSTDVFFYMTKEKQELTKKIIQAINEERIKLTVDINNYDCLTTELSALASKYPNPISYENGKPIYADPLGQETLDFYAQTLKDLIRQQLNLNLQGITREINFVLSQDAHKFHQDQSGKQFNYLNNRDASLPSCNIIQDLTLADWDMSTDTFSATIIQDSLSSERFLLILYPKEVVGMLFTQSPSYLTREAHPSYLEPTIFPYHAVLSPIDKKGGSTPGSSKGKRISTVLRAVVPQYEIENLKLKATPLSLNRPTLFEDERGTGYRYQSGIEARLIDEKILSFLNKWKPEVGIVNRYPDKENTEIFEIINPKIATISQNLAKTFGIDLTNISNIKFYRIIKRDAGFSNFNLMDLNINEDSEIIILNASDVPAGYDFFNLAQDCTNEMLPWIHLYHFPRYKALKMPKRILDKLSLTPIEEILFRKAEIDSMKTDGITPVSKIVTKIDIIAFEKTKN